MLNLHGGLRILLVYTCQKYQVTYKRTCILLSFAKHKIAKHYFLLWQLYKIGSTYKLPGLMQEKN